MADFEGTTFAGTDVEINWFERTATVDGEPADFEDTVEKSKTTTENDEWRETEGDVRPLLEL